MNSNFDDDFDVMVAARFAELDAVDVPDTWHLSGAAQPTPIETPGPRPWMVLTMAASIVLVVAGLALLVNRSDDERIGTASVTSRDSVMANSTQPATQPPPTTQSSEAPGLAAAQATPNPTRVQPGVQLTITPASVVERICGGGFFVAEIDSAWVLGRGDDTGAWIWSTDGTLDGQDCPETRSDAPLTAMVPPIESGRYRFCVSPMTEPAGCAVLEVSPAAPRATADPARLPPGAQVRITPAGVVQRICTDSVIVADVASDRRLGAIDQNGSMYPADDDGRLVGPDCGGDASDEPLTVVVPDLAPGHYRFCVSLVTDPAGCAAVEVLQPSTVTLKTSPTTLTTATPTAPPTTAPPLAVPPDVLVVSGAGFEGFVRNSFGESAAWIREATSLVGESTDVGQGIYACRWSTGDFWLTRVGGLYIVWEGTSLDTAVAGNWGSFGSSGPPTVVDGTGLTVGSTRAEIVAAYGDDITDYGDEVWVSGLRFRLGDDDVVDWMGYIDCGD